MEYISKLWGDNLPFMGKELDWNEQGDEKIFHREVKRRTWVTYEHHR